jgi:hypothetical protein
MTEEMEGILNNIFKVQTDYTPAPASFEEIVDEIDKGRPLIAALMKPTGGGHVVVISGYRSNERVVVLDPLYGKHTVAYQTLIANWQYGYWRGTFTFTTNIGDDSRCEKVQENISIMTPCMTPFGPSMCPQNTIRHRVECENE